MQLPFKINHRSIYLIAFILLAISIPLSRFGMSVAQFLLVGNWFLEGNLKTKLNRFVSNKAALALASLYLLHLLGLLYTTDFQYAMKDLRIKIPLLIFPLILSTIEPVSRKQLKAILTVFVGAVLSGTFISVGIYLFKEINDFREISPFISHVRFSLNTALAIFTSVYLMADVYQRSVKMKIVLVAVIVWLMMFLFIIESVTGIFIVLFVSFILGILEIIKGKNLYYRLTVFLLLVIVPLFGYFYIHDVAKSYLNPNPQDLKNIDKYTVNGNKYINDTINFPVENGHYIGMYICDKELKKEWQQRSNFDFNGKDLKEQPLKYTLYRYLNSKGLRKDSAGISKLDKDDIRAVELGIANYYYTRKLSINTRLYKLLWSYDSYLRGGNPSGHSLLQRFEFWKAAVGIVKNNFWFGVGTGDISSSFFYQYEHSGTRLTKDLWVNRTHNQYLTIFATFGITGFVWFLFSLFYPPSGMKKFGNYLFLAFFITMLLSMLMEDTLETQAGVTLFAFPFSFLLFMVDDGKR